MRLQGGFQDTRKNNEDFALTPYLFSVWVTGQIISIYGIGLCWGYYSIYIGFGFNIPKGFPRWRFHAK
jgi:hypothetical protein